MGEMAQCVKWLATKPHNLYWILRTHKEEKVK